MAHVTIAVAATGSEDQSTRPTGPDRRAAHTWNGMSSGRRRKPPPIDSSNATLTTASATFRPVHSFVDLASLTIIGLDDTTPQEDGPVPTNTHRVSVVLGIEVGPTLIESWCRWLAPNPQPFLVASGAAWPDCLDEGGVLTEELKDTYRLWWGVEKGSSVVWISEAQFDALPRRNRAALVREQVVRRRGAVPTVRGWLDLIDGAELRRQADGHRFIWWPSLVARQPEAILSRVVADRRLPSRHVDVPDDVWRRAAALLPEARHLAGTFPAGSTTNCFGSVMAAAGAPSDEVYADVRPFEAWLATACTPGGATDDAGVVLVWRDRRGAPVHAAVTIGGGWALEKASKDWHAPFAVATVADIMRMARHPGERLDRRVRVTG